MPDSCPRLRIRPATAVAICALLGTIATTAQQPSRPDASPIASDQAPDSQAAAALAANELAGATQPVIAGDTVTVSSPILIPAAGTAGIANPYPAQIAVSGLSASLGRLAVRLNSLTHPDPEDLDIMLVGPAGQRVMLMSDAGGQIDIEAAFITFEDGASALTDLDPIMSGTYAPTNLTPIETVLPAPAPPGPYSTSLAGFIGTNPNGLWSLYVVDDADSDVGRLFGFSLIISPQFTNTSDVPIPSENTHGTTVSTLQVTGLTRPITKVTASLHLLHTWDNNLDIFLVAPDGTSVELSTDNGGSGNNYGTSCAAANRTTFDDLAATSITAGAAPLVGTFRPEGLLSALNGKHANGTWTLRIVDDTVNDVGRMQCWSVSITTEEPVQPPSNLTVADLSANTVTFKWTPSPAGATATSYVFEGGATPGQVLASFPVGVPSLTLAVPDGTFNVRVRSVADGLTSSASNELPIYVNVPIAPSAPSNLLATSNGHTLDLTWRNTFAGGAPTGLLLDVTGDITATLPLPMVERFSYSGVPAGNYTFAVRAANGFGTSAASNTVRRLFPDPSCLRPRAPANFRAFNAGLTVFVDWDSPTVGAAVSHYVLSVSGGLSATIPTTVRALSGNVPPGSYILRLAAVNRCGTGVTPDVSVTVP